MREERITFVYVQFPDVQLAPIEFLRRHINCGPRIPLRKQASGYFLPERAQHGERWKRKATDGVIKENNEGDVRTGLGTDNFGRC